MKKLVYSLAVLFSVAMVSCSGNKAAEAADTDSIVEVAEEVVEVANDSADTIAVAEAAAVEAPADSAK